jgi:hypothetical protein
MEDLDGEYRCRKEGMTFACIREILAVFACQALDTVLLQCNLRESRSAVYGPNCREQYCIWMIFRVYIYEAKFIKETWWANRLMDCLVVTPR